MRTRDLAVLAALLAAPAPAAAQRTGDQARIIFTVSGAYIGGRGLWSVASQPVQEPPFVDDFALSRSIKSTFGAGFSGAYFAGEHIGLTADFFLLGLGYDDACRILGTPQSQRNVEVCNDIDEQEKSAAAVTVSAGASRSVPPSTSGTAAATIATAAAAPVARHQRRRRTLRRPRLTSSGAGSVATGVTDAAARSRSSRMSVLFTGSPSTTRPPDRRPAAPPAPGTCGS